MRGAHLAAPRYYKVSFPSLISIAAVCVRAQCGMCIDDADTAVHICLSAEQSGEHQRGAILLGLCAIPTEVCHPLLSSPLMLALVRLFVC